MSVTLLKMVQDTLSDANSDEVDSITDTVESLQCAKLVAAVYEDIVIEHDIQAVKSLFRLNGLSDTDTPTHMAIPEAYHSVEWIKYNKAASGGAADFQDVEYVTPLEFMERTNARNRSDATVTTVTDPSGVTLGVRNDKHPEFFTMFDDRSVVFDSHDSDVDSTLTQAKTQAYGQQSSTLAIADATVITLPAELIPLLRNEVRVLFMDIHVGGATPEGQRAARRSRVRSQRLRHTMRNNSAVERNNTGPNYGRRPK